MSKIGSSTKIQRLLKESSLLCHSGKFNEAKEIYQALLKLIPNHPEALGSLKIRQYGVLLLKYPEELAQTHGKIQLKNLSNKLRSVYG